MLSQFRNRAFCAALMAVLGAAIASGCSSAGRSTAYLKGLQQTALSGGFADTKPDVTAQCPTCTPDETIFAERIVSAERGFTGGCTGIPQAEASYRQIRTMLTPDNSIPEYQTLVTKRMCEVANRYETCTTAGHRQVPIGDASAPAGALTAAIDQCRQTNSAEADEILNRAIAHESEAINRSVLADDFADAAPELRVYAALPRSNEQRADEWRNTIAVEESVDKNIEKRTSDQIKNMVCDETYFVRNPETGYGATVNGMNMRHGGHIPPPTPFEPAKVDTKESRMAILSWELSNSEELPLSDAHAMLQGAVAHAAKDPAYCGAATD